ncbi:HtaA domain-containing protein [Microbacterium sp. RD1]|uniref:HtaA domain-containing protein n=1 Tax=Microbacterium sp. RD1 TaxID=3457313 RepID=UPI003FA5BA46
MTNTAHGLRWGIKDSLLRYVGALDDGEIVVTAPAVREDDGRFSFPVDDVSEWDPATGLGVIRLAGCARVTGHFGMMSVAIDEPWLEFTAAGTALTVADPDRDPGHRVRIAEVDYRPAPGAAIMEAIDVTATLAPEAMGIFGGQYSAGEPMDPLSFSIAPEPAGPEADTHLPSRVTSDPTMRLSLVIADRAEEAEGVVSLSLAHPDGAPLPEWSPGSHIDIHAGDGLVRQYSLSSLTTDRERWRVTILREDDGAVSRLLHETAKVGSSVEVSLPRNNFVLEASPRYIFVAGGIGITPLVPMIEAAERSGAEWTLVYSGRDRSRMAFVDELVRHGERARVVTTSDQPRVDFRGYFAEPQQDTLVYACGPEALLAELEAATAEWPSGALHVERFVPREIDESGDVDFEVEFVESGVTAVVPAGRSILAVAEEHDIPVISSCSEGTCGTCETVVLGGQPDHRDAILTDAERAANRTMFICVSRSVKGCPLRLEL